MIEHELIQDLKQRLFSWCGPSFRDFEFSGDSDILDEIDRILKIFDFLKSNNHQPDKTLGRMVKDFTKEVE